MKKKYNEIYHVPAVRWPGPWWWCAAEGSISAVPSSTVGSGRVSLRQYVLLTWVLCGVVNSSISCMVVTLSWGLDGPAVKRSSSSVQEFCPGYCDLKVCLCLGTARYHLPSISKPDVGAGEDMH